MGKETAALNRRRTRSILAGVWWSRRVTARNNSIVEANLKFINNSAFWSFAHSESVGMNAGEQHYAVNVIMAGGRILECKNGEGSNACLHMNFAGMIETVYFKTMVSTRVLNIMLETARRHNQAKYPEVMRDLREGPLWDIPSLAETRKHLIANTREILDFGPGVEVFLRKGQRVTLRIAKEKFSIFRGNDGNYYFINGGGYRLEHDIRVVIWESPTKDPGKVSVVFNTMGQSIVITDSSLAGIEFVSIR